MSYTSFAGIKVKSAKLAIVDPNEDRKDTSAGYQAQIAQLQQALRNSAKLNKKLSRELKDTRQQRDSAWNELNATLKKYNQILLNYNSSLTRVIDGDQGTTRLLGRLHNEKRTSLVTREKITKKKHVQKATGILIFCIEANLYNATGQTKI